MAQKFYVVWVGRNPGVYDNWDDAREQIENFPNARFKGFGSSAEAAAAYRSVSSKEDVQDLGAFLTRIGRDRNGSGLPSAGKPDYMTIPEIDLNGWAVDASCMGNPGVMEYRGVELMSGRELFRIGPFQDATNNIGEFLAIVHALALMWQRQEWHTIYSDSVSGMSWVRRQAVKTTLARTPRNEKVFEMIGRAMVWLKSHDWSRQCRVLKWQTELWGEIPADFGRK